MGRSPMAAIKEEDGGQAGARSGSSPMAAISVPLRVAIVPVGSAGQTCMPSMLEIGGPRASRPSYNIIHHGKSVCMVHLTTQIYE